MEITEVRIKLVDSSEDRLKGFCSVTFDDCFVVRDLKIIEGNKGPFVAMPSRKLTSNCPKCRSKNHLRASFCNNCGNKLKAGGFTVDQSGRAKLYADIAHPVNAKCREMIQNRVVQELNREIELAKEPGYKSRYDDDYDVLEKAKKQARRDSKSPSKPSPHSSKPGGAVNAASENEANSEPDSKTPESKGNPGDRKDFGDGIFE